MYDIMILDVLMAFGWTYQEYLQQPSWIVEAWAIQNASKSKNSLDN